MFAGLLGYDDLAEIEHITAPALLVWGDADGLVDRDMPTTLAERLRGAELLVYQGIGHTRGGRIRRASPSTSPSSRSDHCTRPE